MIYHIHFAGVYSRTITSWWPASLRDKIGQTVDGQNLLAETIKESSNDCFVFILTINNRQTNSFDKWIEQYDLKDYIVFEPPLAIENGVHPENGRNLRLVVLASKDHAWRDMYLDEENSDTSQPISEELAI